MLRRSLVLPVVLPVILVLLGGSLSTVLVAPAAAAEAQTISANPSPAYRGDTWSPTASGGGAVTATSTTPTVCTAVGGTVSFAAIGSCVVELSAAATDTHEAVTVTRTVSVNGVPVTYESAVGRRSPDGTGRIVVTLTSPRGGPTGPIDIFINQEREYRRELVAGVTTVPLLPDDARLGEWVEVQIRYAGAFPWRTLTSGRQVAYVLAEQPVSLPSPPADARVGGAWTPEIGWAYPARPSSWTAAGACTRGGDAVRFTAVGDCTVTAVQPGDDTEYVEGRTVRTFAIDRGVAEVSVTGDGLRVGAAGSITADARVGGVTVPGKVTIDFERFGLQGWTTEGAATFANVRFASAGTHEAQVRFEPDDPVTYEGWTGTATVPVARGTQAITLGVPAPATARAGDTWAPAATSGSGLPVALETDGACTVADGTVRFATAGTCTVTAAQRGDADWQAAPELARTVEVARRAAALSLRVPATAVGEPTVATASIDAAGTVQFSLDGTEVGGPVTVVDGRANRELLAGSAGTSVVTAHFTPTDPTVVEPAEEDADLVVRRAPTTTTLRVAADALTADVVPERAAAGTPTGEVVFAADDRILGWAALEDGRAVLDVDLDPTWAGELTASYDGDADRLGSVAEVDRVLPTITARVRAARPPRAGWYDAPVVVAFACTAGTAAVTSCPEPVTVSEGAAASVTRAVTAADGARAEVTVDGLAVDTPPPAVALRGPQQGRVYKGVAPRARCVGSDAGSGLAACVVTRRVSAGRTTVTARATDRAGHASVTTVRYRVSRAWEFQEPAGARGTLRRGERVRLVVLAERARPVVRAAGVGRPVRIGTARGMTRWHVPLVVPADARRGSSYRVRVTTDGSVEVLRFRVR